MLDGAFLRLPYYDAKRNASTVRMRALLEIARRQAEADGQPGTVAPYGTRAGAAPGSVFAIPCGVTAAGASP
jgi:hypothetical protein